MRPQIPFGERPSGCSGDCTEARSHSGRANVRTLDVYNLEFQWPDEAMPIGAYLFKPAADYLARYRGLQHWGPVRGG